MTDAHGLGAGRVALHAVLSFVVGALAYGALVNFAPFKGANTDTERYLVSLPPALAFTGLMILRQISRLRSAGTTSTSIGSSEIARQDALRPERILRFVLRQWAQAYVEHKMVPLVAIAAVFPILFGAIRAGIIGIVVAVIGFAVLVVLVDLLIWRVGRWLWRA